MELPVDKSPLSTAPALGGEALEQTSGMRNRIMLKCILLWHEFPQSEERRSALPPRRRAEDPAPAVDFTSGMIIFQTSRGPIIARRETSPHFWG